MSGKPKRRRASHAPRVDAALRKADAVELRRKGWSFERIAKEVGVSISTAHRYITSELEKVAAETAEAAEQVRQLELERLDRALAAVFQRVDDGDDKAIATMLRLQERRAKLLGLDTPDRHEVTVSDMSPDEIARSLLLGSGRG